MESGFHPLFVHFPIAFISLAYFYQILYVIMPNILPKHLNLWVLIPAAISTIPAMISGQNARVLIEELNDEWINLGKERKLIIQSSGDSNSFINDNKTRHKKFK